MEYEADPSEMLFEEGLELYEQEKFEEAEQKFLASLEFDPSSEETMYNLALVYFELKRYNLSWQLVNRISELDCDELIEELEKIESEIRYEIPESIPDRCGECDYFHRGAIVNEDIGVCTFYRVQVNTHRRCQAYTLAEEGKVSVEEIEKNRDKNIHDIALRLQQSLTDEGLPDELGCPYCGAVQILSETDKFTRRFACQRCSKITEIGLKIRELEADMRSRTDRGLFKILIFDEDYRFEVILAARKEINRRSIELPRNEEFLALLKQRQAERFTD